MFPSQMLKYWTVYIKKSQHTVTVMQNVYLHFLLFSLLMFTHCVQYTDKPKVMGYQFIKNSWSVTSGIGLGMPTPVLVGRCYLASKTEHFWRYMVFTLQQLLYLHELLHESLQPIFVCFLRTVSSEIHTNSFSQYIRIHSKVWNGCSHKNVINLVIKNTI